jgi:serine protease AprX
MARGRYSILLFGLLFISAECLSQINRYMVFFKDKSGSAFSVSAPLQFLSQKAIDRRVAENINVIAADLPVNAAYIQGVKNTGASVFFSTRWMNGLLVQCDVSLISSIQALSYVDRVEMVAPNTRLLAGGRKATSLRKKTIKAGIETQTQLQMLGITDMHADGFRGEGITIAVFDGGFLGVNNMPPFQHIFSAGKYDDGPSHDFVRNTDNVFQYDDHGTEVFSVIAANIPDSFEGGAYNANFQLYVTEDSGSEYRVEEYNWLFAAERADSAGVDIISSSLGYYDFDLNSMNYTTAQMDGKTAVVTQAAQWASDRGIIVVCSAGNEGNIPGWRIVAAPADAEGVLAIGNINAQGTRSPSSSIGPTADGRIKPDLVALGSGVRVVNFNGSLGFSSGTSLAAPLVTSLVAGIWQRFSQLTRAQLIDVLKRTASRAANPDNEYGYGIPNYNAVVNYIEPVPQANLFEVFPNPTADTLKIRSIDPEEISSCIVEIISAQGQVIARSEVNFSWLERSYQTDISSFAAGLYYVRIWLDQNRYVYKVVKN